MTSCKLTVLRMVERSRLILEPHAHQKQTLRLSGFHRMVLLISLSRWWPGRSSESLIQEDIHDGGLLRANIKTRHITVYIYKP